MSNNQQKSRSWTGLGCSSHASPARFANFTHILELLRITQPGCRTLIPTFTVLPSRVTVYTTISTLSFINLTRTRTINKWTELFCIYIYSYNASATKYLTWPDRLLYIYIKPLTQPIYKLHSTDLRTKGLGIRFEGPASKVY